MRESLEEALEGRDETGRTLTPEERHMLGNILSFGELRVDDVMVPRADVVAVEESTSLNDVLRLYNDANHSRMPIYRETLDDPIGMVHIKDVVEYLTPPAGEGDGGPHLTNRKFSLKDVRRDVLFVPPSMPALDLLLKMQATRIHLALVIDEYGGTDGLVSIEDLLMRAHPSKSLRKCSISNLSMKKAKTTSTRLAVLSSRWLDVCRCAAN